MISTIVPIPSIWVRWLFLLKVPNLGPDFLIFWALNYFRVVKPAHMTLIPVKISVISRVCNVCHYTWDEVCSNNSPVVLRKETKDGPHVGRRYFQCNDRDCNERFFKWLDKGTRRYSTRNRFYFSKGFERWVTKLVTTNVINIHYVVTNTTIDYSL